MNVKKQNLLAVIFIFTCLFSALLFTANKAEAADRQAVTFKEVKASDDHVGALDTEGNLWMWGHNGLGQIGNGTREDALTPQLVMRNVESFSLGLNSTAAVDKNGSLWVWGEQAHYMYNRSYDMGDVPIKMMSGIKKVSLGAFFGVALDQAGNLWVWGCNDDGQCADGGTVEDWYYEPEAPALVRTGVKNVFTGYWNTGFLDENGSLWVCGNNTYGQAGIGRVSDAVFEPVRVLDHVKKACFGFSSSIALTESGDVYTWGDADDRELARDGSVDPYIPVKIKEQVKDIDLDKLGAISHLFVLDEKNRLWAGGYGGHGELFGAETGEDYLNKAMDQVTDMAAGYEFSAYIDLDGNLWTAGRNRYGVLGNGTMEDSALPVQVMGIMPESTPGDVDGDNVITANDALVTLKQVVGLISLTPVQIRTADVDGNGAIEANDALVILKRVVGLIDEF